MTGKITQLHPLTPKDVTPRQVVSYDISTLFGLPTLERFNPDLLASRKGLRIYAQMMEDEQVKAVMTFRLSSIIARGWEFKYADDLELGEDERARRIKLYQQAVRELRGSFNDALMAVLRGHIFGFSVVEKVYDSVMFEGRPASGIVELLYRDPTWFRFFTDKYGTLMRCEQWISNEKIEVDLKKFIHYVRAPAEDRYYGQSELRAAYRAWYMKDVVLKLYGRYLERFAGGFAYAELPDDSSLGTGNPEYTKLQDALTDMGNLASLILPPGVKLEVFQPASTGEYREALTYLDLAIAKSVLVPNLLGLSHTGQTGAFAQSQTQLEAYFMTTASDAARLEDTLNEQFFNDLGDLNFGDGQYPRFRFKPASVEHVKWIVKQWQELTGAGVVMTTEADENHLRELLEMPARTEDDSLIAEEKQELDLQGKEAEAKFAPKPAPKAFTLEDLRAELDVRDAKLMASIQPSITLNTGLPPGPDGSTGPSSRDRTGAAAVRFHTPGGHEHDQQSHAGGRGGESLREWKDAGGARAMVASDAEAEALEEYIGDGYMGINEELRGDNETHGDGFYAEEIQHLDAIIGRASLPEDVVLWRGVQDETGNFIREVEGEGALYEAAYSSWTDNQGGASDFAGDGPGGGFYLRMSAQRGQQGFLKLGGVEREYLGARGRTMYVMGITELQDGTKIVDVELGGEGPY